MKVQSYAVAMNAQYFNLQAESTQATISTTTEDFDSDKSSEVARVEIELQKTDRANNQLLKELSQAVLKNIHSESRRVTRDKIEISSVYAEAQSLNFSIKAFIQTEGKEIELSLDVSLSRTFVQKTTRTIELNKIMKDPLVISLNGTMPSLSSKTFSFDIDSDGKSDQISQLNSGNGFLALDKNSNGIIDDGSELFGTKSGDGFKDLSKYDDDKNGWIDENDAIFDKLRIWQKSEGKDELVALGEVGIGAIFLGNTATPFSLKSDSNELLGEIKKSGIVLFENGRAGVISQVDLAVSPELKGELSIVDKLQKNLSALKLDNIYSKDSSKNAESADDRMSKIRGKISALESKLSRASDVDKPAMQAQIGALYSQMMAIIAASLS
ncbi:MAG: hypothetical protein COB99_04115 [Sulfurimonas sp.]|nr:MAG: hypothetical protein COB99_04115 [Sulfurimonas sp.]